MRLYLVRHGETDWNRDNRLQGQTDIPLNENGVLQAKMLRQTLADSDISFDRVYSSPLSRAVHTAAIASEFPESDITIDKRLLEISYGPYEGARFSELNQDMFAFFRDPENVPPPEGVETIQALLERTGSFHADMCGCEGNALVATHGVALRAFLGHIEGDGSSAVWGVPIENCKLYIAEETAGRWQIVNG